MSSSSSSIILISDKDALLPLLREFADENRINIHGSGKEISQINFLKEKTMELGTLSWIKKYILDYISSKGNPLMIICDLRIDSGAEHDPDGLKVLRTIILSYILITRSESLQDLTCNLFILANTDDYTKFISEVKDPRLILNQVKTNDSRINDLISSIKTDAGKFNSNFNIKICDSGSGYDRVKHELGIFLNMIKTKERLCSRLRKTEKEKQASPENRSAEPADIVFRFNSSYYVNGKLHELYDCGKELKMEEIYIIGNFTSFTRVEVIDRLLKLIKTGPSMDYSFRNSHGIVINIPENSVIDVTIPVTLAQLFSKELAGFINIKIKTTMKKSKLMQQSKGYNMIQKNLVVYRD